LSEPNQATTVEPSDAPAGTQDASAPSAEQSPAHEAPNGETPRWKRWLGKA
jgi:hypothetical protein